MSKKILKKPKMTLEKLARMTVSEFAAIRREMVTNFATKDDLLNFATKDDLIEFKEEVVREISQKIILSNDKVITKLDIALKDQAAHDILHRRIEDKLFNHDERIEKLEKITER